MMPVVSPHNRARVFPAYADVSRPFESGGIVLDVLRAIVSLVLMLVAVGAAFAVAYGTEPALASRPGGLEWIMLARRFQWTLVGLSLAASVATIGLVVAGRRSAWWLLVLAPVMFLLYQRFAGANWRRMAVVENPPLVAPGAAEFLGNDSPVIGITLDGNAYAYPTGCLFSTPVVLHPAGDKRVMMMYSPYAGRARACVVDHSIKAREMDIVSMPANAMLLYNSRIGQFINAFTGQTPAGGKPNGLGANVPAGRYTWQQWRTLHPDTRVLASSYRVAGEKVVPVFPFAPGAGNLAPETRVALLATPRPLALRLERVMAGRDMQHLSAGGASLLVVREKGSGKFRVFDRTTKGDLFPQFQKKSVARKPEVAYIDLDTQSLWSADFRCLDGFARGEHLRPIRAEEDLPWGTIVASYGEVELLPKQ